mmetsp:Transcript_30178/g.89612  ORF Transcript_30178/g.89612 Transcript_30178/m.89612 type:complete len:756 (-) Transcript_30178:68-2335(-)
MDTSVLALRGGRSAARSAGVARAVPGDGGLGHAGLAVDVRVVGLAGLGARAALPLQVGGLGVRVGRRALDLALGEAQGGQLRGAVRLARVVVVGDEVARGLDGLQVALDRAPVLEGLVVLGVLLLAVQLGIGVALLELLEVLRELLLLVGERLHVVLVVVLRLHLVVVDRRLLGVVAVEDGLEHVDHLVALGLLALEGAVPGARRVLLGLLQEADLLGLQVRVVLREGLDGLLEEALRLHDVADGLLVLRVLLAARRRVCLLRLAVVLQVLLLLLEHGDESGLRVLDVLVDLVDGALEVRQIVVLGIDALVVDLALLGAEVEVLLVLLRLLVNELVHLLDLKKHLGEGVLADGQEGGDLRQARGLVLERGVLQEQLDLRAHGAVGAGQAQLEEARALAGVHLAEGLRGAVAVQDGDGLRDGLLLPDPEHLALLVVLLLVVAHLLQLHEELLVLLQLRLGGLEGGDLAGEAAVVVAHDALLLVVGGLELVVGRHLDRHEVVEGLLLRLLRVLCRREVGLEGVLHGLEDAHDLSGLRRVGAGEGRLLEQAQGLNAVVVREEGLRRLHGLDNARLHRDEGTLKASHELLVVLRRRQGLVGADGREGLDGIGHLTDGALEVRLGLHESLVLLGAHRVGLVLVLGVLGHLGLQGRDLRAQRPGVALQAVNLRLQESDLLGQVLDGRGLLVLVVVAVAPVLGVELALPVVVRLRLLQHALQDRDHVRDGGRLARPRRQPDAVRDREGQEEQRELHCGRRHG